MAKQTTRKRRRSRGSGSIFPAASGYYYYQWVDARGRKHTKSLRTKNRKEAERTAKGFRDAVSAKDQQAVLEQSSRLRKIYEYKPCPLADAWEAYMRTGPTSAPGTLRNHQRHLTAFSKWLEAEYPHISDLGKVTAAMAQEYADDLWGTGIAAATFNYHRASLHRITAQLAKRRGWKDNPWAKVECKRAQQQKHSKLSKAQYTALMAHLDGEAYDTPVGRELRALFKLALYAGMRLKDAALLQWSDVDAGGQRIRYLPHKTRRRNRRAVVPMLPPVAEALDALDAARDSDCTDVLPLVADAYRNRLSWLGKTVRLTVASICGDETCNTHTAQCKIRRSRYGFHSLRHTFVSACASRKVPIAQLSLMTGDTITTLEKSYIEVDSDPEPLLEAYGEAALPAGNDPARETLKAEADSQPIEAVRCLVELSKLPPARLRELVAHTQEGR